MPQKRKLSAKEVLADIRAGMYDEQLMQKYKLSTASLQSLFGKLLKAGLITRSELDQRAKSPAVSVELVTMEDEDVQSGLRKIMKKIRAFIVRR